MLDTWWCYHICKGGGVPRIERGLGSSRRDSARDSVLLRKWNAYFLLCRWKSWRSCRSVSHWTQVLAASDVAPTRPVCCQWVVRIGRRAITVRVSGIAWRQQVCRRAFSERWASDSLESVQWPRPVTLHFLQSSLRMGPVCTGRVRWVLNLVWWSESDS